MKRIFAAISLIFFTSIAALAQEKSWTLDECVRYAVEHSPRIKKQQSQNDITRQDYLNAIGQLLPSLNAGSSASFNFGRSVDSETNTYKTINSFNNSYSIYSNLTIFDGFANVFRVKMQQANQKAGHQQLELEKEMVAYDTMEAFFNVLYYQRMVELANEQLAESKENLRQAKRLEELGIKAKTDVEEMAAKEAADSYNLTKQKNLLTIGQILLKEKMNFPVEESLKIVDDENSTLVVRSDESVPAIFGMAKEMNPKAQSAIALLRVREMNRRAAKGNFSPVISMEAGLSTGFARYLDGSDYLPFEQQLRNKRGTYVGITLSLPLFNGFSKSATYQRGKSQEIIARYELNETLRSLYSEIEQAVADMNGQADAYRQAEAQREAMETAHQANLRKYEEGLISPLELHTSANRVTEAKAEELNAKLQYRLKTKLVAYYKGVSFIPPDTVNETVQNSVSGF